jgi:hypothetical protein
MYSELVGVYNFRIDLIDKHRSPKKNSHYFWIEVTRFSPFQIALMERNRKKLIKRVRVKPVKIDMQGLLTLKFDHELFYPGDKKIILE